MNVAIIGTGDARDFSTFRKLKSEAILDTDAVFLFIYNMSPSGCFKDTDVHYVKSDSELIGLCSDYSIDCAVVFNTNILFSPVMKDLYQVGMRIYGPSEQAIPLEKSKAFGKKIINEAGIKTPSSREFDISESLNKMLPELMQNSSRWVVKSDFMLKDANIRTCIVKSVEQAQEAIKAIDTQAKLEGSTSRILLEEFVSGSELSVHLFISTEGYTLIPPVRDYKKRYIDGEGLNTHGLGAICASNFPLPLLVKIEEEIVAPLFQCMKKKQLIYTGVLYLGVILTDTGLQLLEINVRPGNPEWISILSLMKSPLLQCIKNSIIGSHGSIIFHSNSISISRFIVSVRYPLIDNDTTIDVADNYLEHAHSLSIDISPENFFLERAGRYSIKDRALCITLRGNDFLQIVEALDSYINRNFPKNVFSAWNVGFDFNREFLVGLR
ncbi:hypothetical protein LOZ86_09875 [Pectobacterium parvum]|uniref:hypothetical protein n=1 Tax=Pectobacterium TaxID=122277 RepID=UPI000CD230C3|nr:MULTISPECIES: hypothetical protein [Pectobacterium]POE06263.1 hypothetical protein BV921_22640 [Pectobacterium odoriferum]UFK41099.1 hypothetical protein LOZ86_09875 [Pectobacterium parvum]GKW44184.1 hypothetical protein PEC301879_40420 [Pectobacterium carotovorum subsp. carotovorum]